VEGVLVEDVLRGPGALPAHRDRALRLDDRREAERCRAGSGGRAGQEFAARRLLIAHSLSPLSGFELWAGENPADIREGAGILLSSSKQPQGKLVMAAGFALCGAFGCQPRIA